MKKRTDNASHRQVLVVHGGAWDIPDEEVRNHSDGLAAALEKGWSILSGGGSALDAVEETVVILENDPTFDAGRGSVLNTDGSVEMDASIMDGFRFKAGAVAVLRNFPNPVRVARRVLEDTEHMLLAGPGCEAFARAQGFLPVPVEHLLTERELERLKVLKKNGRFQTPDAFGRKRGTVGAVAMDGMGRIAAATSTGGTPKKIPGRVGDTPLVGCGTYAEDGVGGISCTGWGEAIMKVMLARETAEAMRNGLDAQLAAEKGIRTLKFRAEGLGGIICLDCRGSIGMSFNTPRMARGFIQAGMHEPFVVVDPSVTANGMHL